MRQNMESLVLKDDHEMLLLPVAVEQEALRVQIFAAVVVEAAEEVVGTAAVEFAVGAVGTAVVETVAVVEAAGIAVVVELAVEAVGTAVVVVLVVEVVESHLAVIQLVGLVEAEQVD